MSNEQLRELWPGWETVRVIGHGSFGAVYEIQQMIGGHIDRAALKVISIPKSSEEITHLRAEDYDDASITRYFSECMKQIENEYAFMAELKGHANIVYCDNIRRIQHDDGFGWDVYIKMELLTPLKDVLNKNEPEEQTVKLGLDMCNALSLCEKYDVIHRDIKPDNIFVARDGNYKLGDFGIAKTMENTTGGTKAGTYEFMAPEVNNNRPYGAQADIYSLGMVMYWMLNEHTGPFIPVSDVKPSPTERAHARDRRFNGEPLPPPLHGSEDLKNIVLKACAYDPAKRYKTAAEMRQDLLTADQGTVIDPPLDPPKKWYRVAALALAAAAVICFAVFPKTPKPEKELPKPTAETTSTAAPLPATEQPAEAAKQPDHEHIWRPATCTESAICTICGEEGVRALGHSWRSATCTEPAICTVCGAVGEPAPGHDWQEATYTQPMTCSRCGAQTGSPLTPQLQTAVATGSAEYYADGRIKSADDVVDGKPVHWVYVYDSSNHFLYRKRCLENVNMNWSKDGMEGTNMHYQIPTVEIRNCIGFTYDFEVTIVTQGTGRGDRRLMVLDGADGWKEVKQFEYPDYRKVSVEVDLDEPISLDGIGTFRIGGSVAQYDCECALRDIWVCDYTY